MAILKLTKKNLIDLNIKSEEIEKLLKWKNYSLNINNLIFASNSEKKIYTNEDFYTRTYKDGSEPIFPHNFLDLIPKYYNYCLGKYLKEQKAKAGSAFVEQAEIERFRQIEIQRTKDVDKHYTNLFFNDRKRFNEHQAVQNNRVYANWLHSDKTDKLTVCVHLIGENEPHYKSPVFHHIDDVLKKYSLTHDDAIKYLLDMQGAFSPVMRTNIIEPIIKYLERTKGLTTQKIETKTKQEQFIQTLIDLFEGFEKFDLIIDVENKKAKVPNSEKIEFEFSNLINEISKGIREYYLKGDLDFIKRISNELNRLELLLNSIDAGLQISIPQFNSEVFIDKKTVKEINALKLNHLKELKGYTANYTSVNLIKQQHAEAKTEQETPETFEELFYNPKHAEPCLKILNELHPPAIDAINNYIGKNKGIFPLWINVLKNHKPQPIIKHFKDVVYKDLLNKKVKGLNLSTDASEFRKQYKRLENDRIELDIKALLSQYSQSGKLGK